MNLRLKPTKTLPDDCPVETASPLYHTLHYKPSPLFFVVDVDVQKVENNIIELTLYTCTPYMLNTVNISPLYADFLLLFMAGACTPFLFFSFKTQKCERTKRAPCHRGRNNPVRLLY